MLSTTETRGNLVPTLGLARVVGFPESQHPNGHANLSRACESDFVLCWSPIWVCLIYIYIRDPLVDIIWVRIHVHQFIAKSVHQTVATHAL